MDKWDSLLALGSLACITFLAALFDGELIYIAVGWASGVLGSIGFKKANKKT